MQVKELERRFRNGDPIVERGSTGRELFVVREGNVLLQWREGEAPHLLTTGDIFGEASAILGRPRAFQAEAEGDVVLMAIDPPLLNRLCTESPEFTVRLIRHLAQRADAPAAVTSLDSEPEAAEKAAEKGAEKGAEAPSAEAAGPDLRRAVEGSVRAFANALLEQASSDEAPAPVRGQLKDLAEVSGLEILDAYVCLQSLLDRRLLRLVDDQLTILDPEQLRALDG